MRFLSVNYFCAGAEKTAREAQPFLLVRSELYAKRSETMTALPPSNTKRYFLDYQTCGEQHTMVMRVDDATTDAEASEHYGNLLVAMDALLFNLVVVRMRVAANGSNVTLPATFTGDTEFGSTDGGPEHVPFAWSFTGKDSVGRIAKVELFGMKAAIGGNYRTLAVDDTSVEGAIAELATTDPVWLTIAGNAPFWNGYANQQINAYWQRQQRL